MDGFSHREAIAVKRDYPGDNQKEHPPQHQQILQQVQQDDLPHEGKPVKQRQIFRPLSPPDGEAVEVAPRAQHQRQQHYQNIYKQPHRVGQHLRRGGIAPDQRRGQIGQDNQPKIQGKKGCWPYLRLPQKCLCICFYPLAVDEFRHIDPPLQPAIFSDRSVKGSVPQTGENSKKG